MTEHESSKQHSEHERFFSVPSPIALHLALYAAVALIMGLATWLVRGGMYTSAVVLGVVFVPLAAMVFYGLVVVPGRAGVLVGPSGVALNAAPFVQASVGPGCTARATRLDDPALAPKDSKVRQGMFMGPYKAGSYELKSGGRAVLLTRGQDVVEVSDGETHLLLGPADMEGLKEALGVD